MSSSVRTIRLAGALLAAAAATTISSSASAQTLFSSLFAPFAPQAQPVSLASPSVTEPEQQGADDEGLRANLRRQIVSYASNEAPGTIIVDTPHTYLYFVLGGGKAIRYGIGVGRQGFTWSGIRTVGDKKEWPDWSPPPEMIARQPYLPRFMAGGPGNPLGARAMYLAGTEYRIHGTNNPDTIGHQVSSGCIRLTNEDVTDLYNRVKVGAKVVVLPQTAMAHRHAEPEPAAYAQAPQPSAAARTWATIRPSGAY
ncbi:MAG TPA: L,D-transpeptidase [Pseudolabrys sp.]|nr:L,D-transpeptidase [Pseudolabrys sp.]